MSGWQSWITELRARLTEPPPRRLPPSNTPRAAVLVPLYVDARELWTVLSVHRASAGRRSQIAFPGGGIDTGEEAWDAALREVQAQIGLAPQRILPIGELDEIETQRGFRILPQVGAVAAPVEARVQSEKLEKVLPVPLSAFIHPTLVEDRPVTIDEREQLMRIYHVAGHQVWGMTAQILQKLLVRLGLEPDPDQPAG